MWGVGCVVCVCVSYFDEKKHQLTSTTPPRLAAQRTRSPVYEEEEAVDDPRPKNTVLRLPKLTRYVRCMLC